MYGVLFKGVPSIRSFYPSNNPMVGTVINPILKSALVFRTVSVTEKLRG